MMLTRNLLDLFRIMIRLASRRARVKDFLEFTNWLHIILNLVVVRVFVGSDALQRYDFKTALVDLLCE